MRDVVTAPVSIGRVATGVGAAPARLGPVRLVVVDGPAGSGKSTFAAALADVLCESGTDVTVFHLDDIYDGWSGLDGVGDHLVTWILEPLLNGRPGRYRRYDWAGGQYAEWNSLPLPAVLVVEGCGAAQREIDVWASLRAWVEAPRALRLQRGIARDGVAMTAEWERWMQLETEHFVRDGTRARADIVVDGTRGLEP